MARIYKLHRARQPLLVGEGQCGQARFGGGLREFSWRSDTAEE